MKRIGIFLLVAVAVYGCSGGQRQTLDRPSTDRGNIAQRYPGDFYIVRSGTGETPEAAAEAARFEIVKYFEAEISGETRIKQWAKSTARRGTFVEERLTEMSNTIAVRGKREIPGIEIVQTSRIKNTSLHETWAVLPKQTYANVLTDRIRKLDTEIAARLASLSGTDLENAGSLARCINVFMRRERDRRDLLLVSTASIDSRERELLAAMSSLDSLIAGELDIGLVLQGDIGGDVSSAIVKGITDAGIRIKDYPGLAAAVGDGVDLVITVSHSATSRTSTTTISSQQHTLYWTDWILSLNALDPATREVMDTVVLSEKSSGRDEAQSRQRMTSKIMTSQVPAITAWLSDLVFKPDERTHPEK